MAGEFKRPVSQCGSNYPRFFMSLTSMIVFISPLNLKVMSHGLEPFFHDDERISATHHSKWLLLYLLMNREAFLSVTLIKKESCEMAFTVCVHSWILFWGDPCGKMVTLIGRKKDIWPPTLLTSWMNQYYFSWNMCGTGGVETQNSAFIIVPSHCTLGQYVSKNLGFLVF